MKVILENIARLFLVFAFTVSLVVFIGGAVKIAMYVLSWLGFTFTC